MNYVHVVTLLRRIPGGSWEAFYHQYNYGQLTTRVVRDQAEFCGRSLVRMAHALDTDRQYEYSYVVRGIESSAMRDLMEPYPGKTYVP